MRIASIVLALSFALACEPPNDQPPTVNITNADELQNERHLSTAEFIPEVQLTDAEFAVLDWKVNVRTTGGEAWLLVAEGALDPDPDGDGVRGYDPLYDAKITPSLIDETYAAEGGLDPGRVGSIELQAEATDGFNTTQSAILTLTVNWPPSAPEVSFTYPSGQDAFRTLDTVVAKVDRDGVDPQGNDVVTKMEMCRLVDGSLIQCNGRQEVAAGGTRTISDGSTSRGQTWVIWAQTCEDTAGNGQEGSCGPEIKVETTIANSPPQIAGVTVKPTGAGASSDLLCEVGEVTDPDDADLAQGEDVTLTYAWTQAGTAGTPYTEYPWILPGFRTTEGQSWTCTVSADDGFVDAPVTLASAPVSIGSRRTGMSALGGFESAADVTAAASVASLMLASASTEHIAVGHPEHADVGAVTFYQERVAVTPAATAARSVRLVGEHDGGEFGSSLLRIPSVGEDDGADLLVGAPGALRVYVLPSTRIPNSGDILITAVADKVVLTPPTVVDVTGFGGIALAGGAYTRSRAPTTLQRSDVAVTAHGVDDDTRRVFLYPQAPNNTYQLTLDPKVLTAPGPGIAFGDALAIGGDTTGNGTTELLVGAPGAGFRVAQTGETGVDGLFADVDGGMGAVLYESSTNPVTGSTRLTGFLQASAGGGFGAAVAFVPDGPDGDGYDDVLVAAPDDGEGVVYLYEGRESWIGSAGIASTSAALAIRGKEAGDRFGETITVFPGATPEADHRVVISAPGLDSSAADDLGGAYVFLLHSGLLPTNGNTAQLRAETIMESAYTGPIATGEATVVGPSGDLDGDGVPDLLFFVPFAGSRGQVYTTSF